MSPNEYKSLTIDFTEALKKRCQDEGLGFQIMTNPMLTIQYGSDCTFYVVGNELYYLKHTGEQVSWDFIGRVG